MPKIQRSRAATHSGSWYENDEEVLAIQIRQWLDAATLHDVERIRAVIAPHAGYKYCGHVMAHAYKHISPTHVQRVFLLGPSHHFYSRQCHISPHHRYETPLGHAVVDTAIYDQLSSTGKFVYMNPSQDEAEHSLELHMPFLMETMRGKDFTLVPIVVGALSPELEAEYGELLAPYLEDPSNFFIVSSDFCHWGSRFNYVYYHRAKGEIHESIEWLDREGMNLIESGDPRAFSGYLSKYGNTICGRHPIGVFLNALSQSKLPHDIKFTAYDQSHKCQTLYDSSVSYASAIISLAGTAQENGRS